MNFLLHLSSVAFVILGVAHSYLGERFVLSPILPLPELPRLFGSRRYMQQILRLAWHAASLAWFGLASIVAMLAYPSFGARNVSLAVGVTALMSMLSVFAFTRGKHVAAWVLFLFISLVTLYRGAIL